MKTYLAFLATITIGTVTTLGAAAWIRGGPWQPAPMVLSAILIIVSHGSLIGAVIMDRKRTSGQAGAIESWKARQGIVAGLIDMLVTVAILIVASRVGGRDQVWGLIAMVAVLVTLTIPPMAAAFWLTMRLKRRPIDHQAGDQRTAI